ncbi:hypothetical protein [Streptomyces mirabilis]|uniref:hypothetical protein n=1 Tax=Streptomyces mirabilis TaxID=68239 RepID=UPI0033ED3446
MATGTPPPDDLIGDTDQPPLAQPGPSAPADEVLERIADLAGCFAEGRYTPKDIQAVFARIEEAGGPHLVCAWAYWGERGFSGNSELYVEVDGELHHISPALYRWLRGHLDFPGRVETWACAPVTAQPTFVASAGFYNRVRTVQP